MRLSRIDLLPLLAIMAGGVLGASLSFGFLALAPSGDVRVIAPIVSVEVLRLEAAKANSMEVYFIEQVEALRRLQEAQRDPPDQFRRDFEELLEELESTKRAVQGLRPGV